MPGARRHASGECRVGLDSHTLSAASSPEMFVVCVVYRKCGEAHLAFICIARSTNHYSKLFQGKCSVSAESDEEVAAM